MARLVRWQTFLAALGILVVGGLLAQFSLTRQVAIVPVRGGVYVEGMVGAPKYLNPLLATTDADRSVASLLFEGLSALQADGSVTPALAQEWEVSVGGTVYTCTLRSDVRWHDGHPLTTADVSFTLRLIVSPELPDPNRLADLWSRVQTTVLDERRLRFTLEQPYAPFLSYTTLPILPEHLLRDVSPDSLPLSTFNLNPVGTGPFRLARLEETEDGTLVLHLEANPLYYRQEPPSYLEGIQVRFYRDEGALLQALRQEEIDGAFGLSAESLASLSDETDLVAYRTYLQAYTILFLNIKSPLLADRRVRQAIAMGLDLSVLIREAGGQAFPANGPISPISWAYRPDLAPLPHDPAGAQALLEEAGWRDGDGDGTRERDVRQLELTLLTRDIPPERVLLARGIERQLAPLGIAVNVVVEENPDEFRRLLTDRQFDLLLYGWQVGRDPDEFVLWHSSQIGPGGLNLSSFQNEAADQLLEQGRSVLSRDLRTGAYWQFQELFVQEVPAIPLYYPVYTYVVHSRVHGVALAPLNDLGDRFQNVAAWYTRTQKVILGQSQPAPQYGRR